MNLGFVRPVYVKTGQAVDIDTHSKRPIYNYIEWLGSIARKYGMGFEYGMGPKGHYVEIDTGFGAHVQRVYTLHAAKTIRQQILRCVAQKLVNRIQDKKIINYQYRLRRFVGSLTPEQKAFWEFYNKKLEDDRGW